MRKLYQELMSIKKQEKISDKAIMLHMAMMIMIILTSLATMSMSAYAFFTCNITSGTNTITAAKFEVDITIEEKGVVLPEVVEESVKSVSQGDVSDNLIANQALQGESNDLLTKPVIEEEELELTVISTHTENCSDEYSLSMKGGNVYTITLEQSDSSTAKTGFVIITTVDCDSRYHTQQIGISDGNTAPLTFVIKPNGDTMVTFTAHWGTSSYYDDYKAEGDNEDLYITQGKEITLSINDAEEKQKEKLTIPAKDSKEETMESKLSEISSTTEQTGLDKTSEQTEPNEATEQASTEEEQESSETTASAEDTPVEITPTETTDASEPTETASLETPKTQEAVESTVETETVDESVMPLSEEIQDVSEITVEAENEAE